MNERYFVQSITQLHHGVLEHVEVSGVVLEAGDQTAAQLEAINERAVVSCMDKS